MMISGYNDDICLRWWYLFMMVISVYDETSV